MNEKTESAILANTTTPPHAHPVSGGPHAEASATSAASSAKAPAKPAAKSPDVVTVKLRTPFSVDGKEIAELSLNFAKLTARDHINIEEEMLASGLTVMKNAAFSTTYCLYIAARACGVGIGDLECLGFRDSNAVIKAVQNFMMVSE